MVDGAGMRACMYVRDRKFSVEKSLNRNSGVTVFVVAATTLANHERPVDMDRTGKF